MKTDTIPGLPDDLRTETERASHYFHASLPARFDAVLHFDRTRIVAPLERTID